MKAKLQGHNHKIRIVTGWEADSLGPLFIRKRRAWRGGYRPKSRLEARIATWIQWQLAKLKKEKI